MAKAKATINKTNPAPKADWASLPIGSIIRSAQGRLEYAVIANDNGKLSVVCVNGGVAAGLNSEVPVYRYAATENDRLYVYPFPIPTPKPEVTGVTLELSVEEAAAIRTIAGMPSAGGVHVPEHLMRTVCGLYRPLGSLEEPGSSVVIAATAPGSKGEAAFKRLVDKIKAA